MDISEIGSLLQSGGTCIVETDTIPGMFCNPIVPTSVDKIYNTKKRDQAKPFAIFLPNVIDILKYAYTNTYIRQNIPSFLPGPYTILLHANRYASSVVDPRLIKDGIIGIRVSSSPRIKDIAARQLIAGTSVNISGEMPARDLSEVAPSIYIDYIDTEAYQDATRRPSVIVDFTTNPYVVISREF